jgi:nicotinate-nucleotide adenylyltransferase
VQTEQPIWYLVPDGVVQYIAKHRLYRGPAALAPEHPDGAESPSLPQPG